MTPRNHLYLIAVVLAVAGWGAEVKAEDDVTVITPATSSTAPEKKDVASDGTPVIHKSLHKKKSQQAAATASGTGSQSNPASSTASTSPATANKPAQQPATIAVVSTVHPQPAPPPPVHAPINPVAMKPAVVVPTPFFSHSVVVPLTTYAKNNSPAQPPPPTPITPVSTSPSLVPTVETGLPVARNPGMGTSIPGVSTYIPAIVTLPANKALTGATTHQPIYASVLPASVVPLTSTAAGSYSTPSRTTTPPADFVFTNFTRKPKMSYPWKTGIITTIFWIGEGGSNVSSTDNVASAWDENWRSTNRGSDNPNDRNGYASADHASTVNPFYVALPFNDLAFPDKAAEYVPKSWHRPREDGKDVSACKDRWVWIKNSDGHSCFAQWEDVGPLRYDHAEYVFGGERPIGLGGNHAGLDVSPAVAQYLGIDGKNRITSWRFVDDEDVPPGAWLKYDEQAVIFTAMHLLRNSSPLADLPIQKATEPIDEENIDSNKKKVDASKG